MTPDDFDRRPADEGVDPGEAEQERVRRLLEAAADEPHAPMPDDVVRRLDDVLAGLVAERGGSSTGDAGASPVVSLSQRRARRWPNVLVAAAAVTVVALGVGTVIGSDQVSEQSAGTAASDAGGAEDSRVQSRPSPQDARPEAPSDLAEKPKSGQLAGQPPVGAEDAAKTLPDLRSDSLTAGAQAVADSSLGHARTPMGDRTELRECAVPATEQGDALVAVRFDGKIATIAFRAAEDGLRLAEVYACDSARSPVASTRVEAN